MKIAFYTPTLNVGGYEKVVINYANAFCKLHDVILLCGNSQGVLVDSIFPKVNVVNFNVRARGFIKALSKWLKENEVDILYVPFNTYTAMAVVAKRKAKSKVIIYGSQHGYEKFNKIIEIILARYVKKADVLTAVSSGVADYDSKRLKINRHKYYIFDNPVFFNLPNPVLPNDIWLQDRNTFYFATVGRLAIDKHIEIPIKIINECMKAGLNTKLLILGNGPLKQELEDLVDSLNMNNYVKFYGYVDCPVNYLVNCSGYFQTSEIESFGNGVIEALYCNVPAIVTDCGGPVDIIEQDKFGINIGKFDDEKVITNGVQAVKDIVEKNKVFIGMREKALKYDAKNLEKQFLEPYYEYCKKNI